jgi:hypothetical protein
MCISGTNRIQILIMILILLHKSNYNVFIIGSTVLQVSVWIELTYQNHVIPVFAMCKVCRIKYRSISQFNFRVSLGSWICTNHAQWPWQNMFLFKLFLPHIQSGSLFSDKAVGWTNWDLIPNRGMTMFLLQKAQIGTEEHKTFYSICSGMFFSWGKSDGAWSWSLPSIAEVINYSSTPPISSNGVKKDKFTLKYTK